MPHQQPMRPIIIDKKNEKAGKEQKLNIHQYFMTNSDKDLKSVSFPLMNSSNFN